MQARTVFWVMAVGGGVLVLGFLMASSCTTRHTMYKWCEQSWLGAHKTKGVGTIWMLQCYDGGWCHPLPCWPWDHTLGWLKIIEHLVLQALTPLMHWCARRPMWLQSSQQGGWRAGGHWVGGTIVRWASPRGSKQASQVSIQFNDCVTPSGGRLRWHLLSGCKSKRGRVRCVVLRPEMHTRMPKSNRVLWNPIIPLWLLSFGWAYLLTLPPPPQQSVTFTR